MIEQFFIYVLGKDIAIVFFIIFLIVITTWGLISVDEYIKKHT